MSESNETFQEFPHNQPASSQADTVLSRTDITIVESAWVGPLPPPEILRRLEDIIPGAAERILRMSELQEQHQHRMEETVINIQRAAIVGDSKNLSTISEHRLAETIIRGGVIMSHSYPSVGSLEKRLPVANAARGLPQLAHLFPFCHRRRYRPGWGFGYV